MILGLTIDNKLSIDILMKNICIKASQKICPLSKISGYLDLKP